MCAGMKMLKHNVETTLRLAHHVSCTRLRILLKTICRKPGFNSLRTLLNYGAEQVSNETLKQTQQRNDQMLPRAGKLH